MRLATLLFFLLFYTQQSLALSPTELVKMAQSREWLAINYYTKNILNNYQSQILDKKYFLSEEGVENPLAELKATLRLQFTGDKNQEFICKYPARYQFISKFKNNDPNILLKACTKLNVWKRQLNASSLSLIYPSQSMESSLALFSHTFLKINDDSKPRGSSLNTVISYAAAFGPNESLLSLAFNGVFGGYTGKFGTSFFYDELLRYGYKETRDIFEYRLNFTAHEIDRILNHLWEVQDVGIRYYFLDQNCSFYLLTLMEIGRPQLKLSEKFKYLVPPAETVRAVAETEELVSEIHHYPSKENKRQQRLSWMSEQETHVYSELKKDFNSYPSVWKNLSQSLDANSQARVLDGFNDYLTYLETDIAIQLRPKVLADRSQIKPLKPEKTFIQTRMRPEEGHKTHRVGFGFGENDHGNYLNLNWRLVLHDRLDPGPAYVKNTDLETLSLDLRLQGTEFDLESLTLFKVTSIQPITNERFAASSHFHSLIAKPRSDHLANYKYFTNIYGRGVAYTWGNSTIDTMLNLYVNAHPNLHKGYQAGIGAETTAMTRIGQHLKIKISYHYQDFSLGEKNYFSQSELNLSWSPSIQRSWQVMLGRYDNNTQGQVKFLFYY